MTYKEWKEVYLRCYMCGIMGGPSFWSTEEGNERNKIAFCKICLEEITGGVQDLPMIPVPYLELFYD